VIAELVWDGAAFVEVSELMHSSGLDVGYARVPDGLDPWLPPRGPRHLSEDGREQRGADGIGGFIPMPSREEEAALVHDDDFMLCGGAIIEVIEGEAVPIDPRKLERMRRRLSTLRRHQLAEDFAEKGQRG